MRHLSMDMAARRKLAQSISLALTGEVVGRCSLINNHISGVCSFAFLENTLEKTGCMTFNHIGSNDICNHRH